MFRRSKCDMLSISAVSEEPPAYDCAAARAALSDILPCFEYDEVFVEFWIEIFFLYPNSVDRVFLEHSFPHISLRRTQFQKDLIISRARSSASDSKKKRSCTHSMKWSCWA